MKRVTFGSVCVFEFEAEHAVTRSQPCKRTKRDPVCSFAAHRHRHTTQFLNAQLARRAHDNALAVERSVHAHSVMRLLGSLTRRNADLFAATGVDAVAEDARVASTGAL